MKLKHRIRNLLFLLILITKVAFTQSTNYFETSKNLEIFTELYKELDMFYVDDVESGELIKTAIDKMLISLDPYTSYIPETDIEDYRFMTTGQYGGIGAIISRRDDYVYINEPYEGFPAEKAGMMAGDKILVVNGKSAKGKTTEDLSSILKGAPNTQVQILIERDEKEILFKFNREKVTVKSVPYYGFLEDGVGYIKLRSFTRNCSNEIKKALENLKKEQDLRGVVLDLRSNPGGLLNESIDIVNLFVEKGQEVVITKGKIKDWEKSYKATKQPEDVSTPLVVLINSSSASASEIVSGAIQDLDRGVVVGQRSFGKGLVQQTRQLPYNSQLKVTVAKYYIPSGRCIQALDYSNRNDDGSVGKMPDSLMSIFKTKNGREVKDGGGIEPDINIDKESVSEITISLMTERLIFDFATKYRLSNKSIISVKDFKITDEIFNDFKSFLSDKDYKYETMSEDAISVFKEILLEENLLELVSEQIDLIDYKINEVKENDLDNNRVEVSKFLADEIVSRYYYQKGRIIQQLKNDPYITQSLRIFNDLDEYNKILNVSK